MKPNLDVCPNCGCDKLLIHEKWDEEYGEYVVGSTVYCANCEKD